MSWLASGLTQSVTGKINQLSGQLKDILTEGTEEIYDPSAEIKVLNDKIKESEKRIEILKMECSRWEDESNELNLKCRTYEAQFEQKQNEFRQQIISKDTLISELRNQVNNLEQSKNESVSPTGYQKSVFMEEFEEVMPSSDLNDYIHLQKEIKRLKEDNLYLSNENKELLNKLKSKPNDLEEVEIEDREILNQQHYESIIENLKQEIFTLKNRLDNEKDVHQEQIISIQNSYNEKVNSQLNENKIEIETLKSRINELETCPNQEVYQLKTQIEMFESELEQANSLILKLKNSSKSNSESPSKEIEGELDKLRTEKSSLELQLAELKKNSENDLDEKEKLLDSLRLELKQQQQSIQQDKLMQMQEQKQERQEIAKLKSENTELKIKLDEKLSEITLLGAQINELNDSLNKLKSNDSALFNELKLKTEQFLVELNTANQEIASLKSEKDTLIEQRKQFEFVLDEKTKETSQLKSEVQKNIQHLAAQSQAMKKLQEDLKNSEHEKIEQECQTEQMESHSDELSLLKHQYNQIYAYLEQKNQESLSYYNEIQRLNLVISELNRELLNSKSLNENLNEQYEALLKGFQLEQKIVEDLNQQTFELNSTLMNIKENADQQKAEIDQEKENEAKLSDLVEELKLEKENLNVKISETESYYENALKSQAEAFKATLNAEEQQRLRLSKELERLKEHLVEMSDNYTKDAIQAEEREKQLRLALNEAQLMVQKQGATLESSSKELEIKVEQLSQLNQELKNEKEKLKEKLKQSEENLNHQIKVAKNLELVLERLQNEKDSQHQLELSRFQQTIKEQASKIHSLQKEAQNYQHEIEDLKELIDTVRQLESQLEIKNEENKKLEAQIGTKEALIDSLEKRVNETQKVNDSYIEKEIIKNLVIGYIKVNQNHEKKQVLKLIATMLNFNPTELEQVEQAGESKWFGLLKSSPPNAKTSKTSIGSTSVEGVNKSFAELLIQYVDRESRPKPNLQFDLNKKIDTPQTESSNLSNSESAVKFFNSSANNSDLTLVNRSATSSSQNSSNSNTIAGLSSPAVANSFLEQILK